VSQIVCAHCGEVFQEGKLVCPHCGIDAEFTHAEEPNEFDFGTPDTSSYEDFLENEGLAPPSPRPKRGLCVLLLAGPVISGLIWVLLL
jgi:predicted  nucleic acid-binding Zn-ribbon protein